MTEPAATSAGSLLRAAREKQGLHIAALAAAIKVAPRKLDALENDRWSELPDATFARALAQTVCRTLKIDPKPVLDLLPSVGSSVLENATGGLNMPFRERSGRDDPAAFAAIKPMVWAASVLMVAAVVVYFLPEGLFDGSETTAAVPPPPVASAPAALPETPAVAAAPAASDAAASAAAAASAPQVETVFAAPPAASAALAGLVQLNSSEPSWVEARDGRGQVLLSRTVQPGESVGLDGALPIRLTIGNAAATQLSFKGRPVDLNPRTRDNVARLELQ